MAGSPISYPNLSYFQTEHSSYEYRTSLAGLTPATFNERAIGANPNNNPTWRGPRSDYWLRRSQAQARIAPSSVWFARDYNNFHGKGGTNGSRRYVYIDAHVTDYEN